MADASAGRVNSMKVGERASVPCNGRRLCCINDAIILHPEHGDDPALYQTVPVTHPLNGRPALMLDHKPNGECVYLGPTGCLIHDRAPVICREYDCRRQYLQIPRAERRRLVRSGLMSADKFNAGRDRVHTLDQRH
jgi:hypothetical protein